MRFKDGSVKVANESEFIREFQRKAIDPYWKSLECIHTCINSKFGVGKHYFVPFKASLLIGSSESDEYTYAY